MSYNRKELKKSIEDLDKPTKKKLNKNLKQDSMIGYSGANPDARPWIDIYTDDGVIDMTNTAIPLVVEGQYLPPHSGQYQFNKKTIREYRAQYGKQVGPREKPHPNFVQPDRNRPYYTDNKGQRVSENKITVGFDDQEYVLPTVWGGDQYTNDQAIQKFIDTGEHMGTSDRANKLRTFIYNNPELQLGGTKYSSQDSLRHQAGKTMDYEFLKGSAQGTGLSNYGNPALGLNPSREQAVEWYMENIAPKLGHYSSAMEKGEAGDFLYNSGKDIRPYAIQEYLKETDPQNKNKWQDGEGKYKDRNDSTKWDTYWSNIEQLPENDRRVLINKGRDWYYQNINNPSPGVPSDAYKNTWYGRIWNTNDFKEFDPNNPKFQKQEGGQTNWLEKYQTGTQVSGVKRYPVLKNKYIYTNADILEQFQDKQSVLRQRAQCSLDDTQHNCLASTNDYFNKYVAPGLEAKSTWDVNEAAGITSGDEYYGTPDSWDVHGLLQEKGAEQVYAAKHVNSWNKLSDKEKKDIYSRFTIGTLVGIAGEGPSNAADKAKGYKSYNKKKGLIGNRHSARVIAFGVDGMPILNDYGRVVPLTMILNNWPITNVTIPKEYKDYTFDKIKEKYPRQEVVYDPKNILKVTKPAPNNIKSTPGVKEEVYKPYTDVEKEFVNGLNETIPRLMEMTGLPQEEINKYAKIAFGILQGETEGGRSNIIHVKRSGAGFRELLGGKEASKGWTRMKINDLMGENKDTPYASMLRDLGVDETAFVEDENKDNIKKQAAATLALLLSRSGSIEGVNDYYLKAQQHQTPFPNEDKINYLREGNSNYANNIIEQAKRVSDSSGPGIKEVEDFITSKKTSPRNIVEEKEIVPEEVVPVVAEEVAPVAVEEKPAYIPSKPRAEREVPAMTYSKPEETEQERLAKFKSSKRALLNRKDGGEFGWLDKYQGGEEVHPNSVNTKPSLAFVKPFLDQQKAAEEYINNSTGTTQKQRADQASINPYTSKPYATGEATYVPIESLLLPGTPIIKGLGKVGNMAVDAVNPLGGLGKTVGKTLVKHSAEVDISDALSKTHENPIQLNRNHFATNREELKNLEQAWWDADVPGEKIDHYFDFRNDNIGEGMKLNGKDISTNRRKFDIKETAKLGVNSTWAKWKDGVIPTNNGSWNLPMDELLKLDAKKGINYKHHFNPIQKNKYGGKVTSNWLEQYQGGGGVDLIMWIDDKDDPRLTKEHLDKIKEYNRLGAGMPIPTLRKMATPNFGYDAPPTTYMDTRGVESNTQQTTYQYDEKLLNKMGYRSKPKTGWLDKYQGGGFIKYFDDEKEFNKVQQAYSDSLQSHKFTVKKEKEWKKRMVNEAGVDMSIYYNKENMSPKDYTRIFAGIGKSSANTYRNQEEYDEISGKIKPISINVYEANDYVPDLPNIKAIYQYKKPVMIPKLRIPERAISHMEYEQPPIDSIEGPWGTMNKKDYDPRVWERMTNQKKQHGGSIGWLDKYQTKGEVYVSPNQGTLRETPEKGFVDYLSQANDILIHPFANLMSLGQGDNAETWAREHGDNSVDESLSFINPFAWVGNVPDSFREGDYVSPVLGAALAGLGSKLKFVKPALQKTLFNPKEVINSVKPTIERAQGPEMITPKTLEELKKFYNKRKDKRNIFPGYKKFSNVTHPDYYKNTAYGDISTPIFEGKHPVGLPPSLGNVKGDLFDIGWIGNSPQTGYTDVPFTKKMMEKVKNELGTKLSFGKRPLETKISKKDQSIFNSGNKMSNDMRELFRSFSNTQSELDALQSHHYGKFLLSPEDKSLFENAYKAKDAYKYIHPNKMGGQHSWLDKYM